MKKGKGGIIAGVLAGLVVFGGIAAVASAAGGRTKRPEKPGPQTGPGGKGKIFGGGGGGGGGGLFGGGGGAKLPPGLPADFDFGGNDLWVSPDCEWVVEGNRFWQTNKVNAEEAPTLEAVLAIDDNGVNGFIDYLINDQGFRSPEEITWRILQEASPLCADLDPEQWGEGLAQWFENFVARIVPYVEETTGGIGFDDE